MTKSNKRKLTLLCEDKLIKTLKVKAIQHDVSVSQLVEILALVAERDKKLFNEMSTSKVKYHDVDSYQSLLDVMKTLK